MGLTSISRYKPWVVPDKPSVELGTNDNENMIISYDDVLDELQDSRYFILGHGTLEESAKQILENGLFVGNGGGYFAADTDIDSNFLSLDFEDKEQVKESLDNWKHRDYKHIVLYRMPKQHIMQVGSNGKAESLAVGFHYDNNPENYYRGVYEREFIYGYYDSNTSMIHKNLFYHGDLDKIEDAEFMKNTHEFLKEDFDRHLKQENENSEIEEVDRAELDNIDAEWDIDSSEGNFEDDWGEEPSTE